MKQKHISLIIACVACLMTAPASAQGKLEKLQVKARVGYSIGATAPLGMPATIRSIESFKLTPNFMLGVDAMYPLSEKSGLQLALHYDIKDMDSEVTTKGYHMKVTMDDDEMEGVYTGHVRQMVRERMLTIPLQLTYELSPKLQLKGGPYLSLLLAKDFYGYAFDGYLRRRPALIAVRPDGRHRLDLLPPSGALCRPLLGTHRHLPRRFQDRRTDALPHLWHDRCLL